jgi:hypothetical protein
MIPNVGNMSFYMSTMICDFASEILNQFAILVRIQKKNNKNVGRKQQINTFVYRRNELKV